MKVPKKVQTSKSFQSSIVSESVSILAEFYNIYCYNIAFPELALPATVALKKFIKTATVSTLKKRAQQLIDNVNKKISVLFLIFFSVG